jgi:homocysteine S-methyltransferase
MSTFAAELASRVLICDGAMGTMLHAAGNSLDSALPDLNLSDPGLVGTIHDAYLSAGADIIQTNTFGASRLRLARHGAKGSVAEINKAGARIAREARDRAMRGGAGREIFVAGSVSPAVTARQRAQVDQSARVAAISEQIEALAEAGCDLLILETFGFLPELVEAASAAASLTGLPVIAQATFSLDGCTLGGESPREVASALNDLPITAMGTNCTLGPQHTLTIVEQLRLYSKLPVTAQPNAGLPRRVHGRRFEYDIDCDYFGRYAGRYAEAGAALVGGCCGTTPAHIQAAAARVSTVRQRREHRPVARTQAQQDSTGLAERLGARQFAVAAEIAPPVGGSGDQAVEFAAALREHGVDLFFVAARDTPRAQLSSLNLSLHLRQQLGTEAFATVTTWDKTIMTLQADLLGAHALGLRTVVCETGNPPLRADYPNVDGIWEVDSVGLIGLLAALNQGRDSNSLGLATKTSFQIGARFNPGAADLSAEIARTQAKLQAGAQFLISRPVYELDTFRQLRPALAEQDVPVLLTIAPLRSFDQAEYLAHEVPGVMVPDAALRALASAGADAAQAGLEMAAALAAECRGLADGVVLSCDDPAGQLRLLSAAGGP